MKININGQPYDLSILTNKNLHSALTLFLSNHQNQGTFAVAINGEFISKENYQTTLMVNNDSIDVLFPIQGG